VNICAHLRMRFCRLCYAKSLISKWFAQHCLWCTACLSQATSEGAPSLSTKRGELMRTKPIFIAIAGLAIATPAANAATCVQIYEKCLNDTWDTSGFARILADLECAAKYAGCVRAAIL
jgi:hypothetical protein